MKASKQINKQTVILLIALLLVDGVSDAITEKTFYFNEFVANVLRDNMGMIIFDLGGCRDCFAF